jgi:hypothetical protein
MTIVFVLKRGVNGEFKRYELVTDCYNEKEEFRKRVFLFFKSL